VKLLFTKPFYGNLILSLDLVDATDWCKTAATDGLKFYYNRDFIDKLTKPELLFLCAHEVLHCVYDHLGGRRGKDPQLWNMATDYYINYALTREKVGSMPKMGLYREDFTDDMTSGEIYDHLVENSAEIEMTLDEHLELGDGDGGGEGSGDGDGDGEGSPGGSGGKTVKVRVMGQNGPPVITEENLKKIRNQIKANVIRAAGQAGADNVPKNIRRMIQTLVTPKMDWRALLDSHIRSSVRDDYTYQRLSRRSWNGGYLFPAQDYKETIDIAVAVDVSGSMTDEMLRDMLSEVKGIMLTFGDFKLTLFTFDTSVYEKRVFTGANIDEIDSYPGTGGGGTSFRVCWDFMKTEGIQPERFVMFTDGYPWPSNDWGDPNYCDTMFVIYGNPGQNIVAPFGVTAYYEPRKGGATSFLPAAKAA
jgi:predicted metal-dependent peptidase